MGLPHPKGMGHCPQNLGKTGWLNNLTADGLHLMQGVKVWERN
jgi:hypothetical protein